MSLSNRLALSSGGANGANTLLSLVWMLFCVLVIVVLAYLFTKYIAGRGSAAVIASGGTEQFTSYLVVSPARRLSLAISATNDSAVPWLEVLEDIGGEALKLLGKERKEDYRYYISLGEDIELFSRQ